MIFRTIFFKMTFTSKITIFFILSCSTFNSVFLANIATFLSSFIYESRNIRFINQIFIFDLISNTPCSKLIVTSRNNIFNFNVSYFCVIICFFFVLFCFFLTKVRHQVFYFRLQLMQN